jgi:serine/threonine protein kinase
LKNEYSEKSDVYSFGVILWEMETRKDPFEGFRGEEIAKKVTEGHKLPIPPETVPQWGDIIVACIDVDPGKRPTFSQIMIALQDFKLEKKKI